MQYIELADKYKNQVLKGTKTQTIRKGRRGYSLGSAKFVFSDSKCNIDIKEIAYKKLNDVTIDEAKRDGFKTLTALIEELLKYYPDIKGDSIVTLVKFDT